MFADDGDDEPTKGNSKKVSARDFEKVMGEHPHELKEDLMGNGSNSRFDIYRNNGWIYLMEKSTGKSIPRYTRWNG